MNIQDWFPLGLTGLISLQSKGLSRVFSPAPWFESISSSALSLLHGPTCTSIRDHWKNHNIDNMDLCWQSPNPFICLSVPEFLCPHCCCLWASRLLQTEQTYLQMCVLTCAYVFDLKTGQESGAAEGEAVGPGQAVPTVQTPVWLERIPERPALRRGSCCPWGSSADIGDFCQR